jgi:hypothetical protein
LDKLIPTLVSLQKKKSRRKREDVTQDSFQRLTDEEKSDLVSQAIEVLQGDIDQVGPHHP